MVVQWPHQQQNHSQRDAQRSAPKIEAYGLIWQGKPVEGEVFPTSDIAAVEAHYRSLAVIAGQAEGALTGPAQRLLTVARQEFASDFKVWIQQGMAGAQTRRLALGGMDLRFVSRNAVAAAQYVLAGEQVDAINPLYNSILTEYLRLTAATLIAKADDARSLLEPMFKATMVRSLLEDYPEFAYKTVYLGDSEELLQSCSRMSWARAAKRFSELAGWHLGDDYRFTQYGITQSEDWDQLLSSADLLPLVDFDDLQALAMTLISGAHIEHGINSRDARDRWLLVSASLHWAQWCAWSAQA